MIIIPQEKHSFGNRRLSVFDENLLTARHRWYPFKEGFSQELIAEAIEPLGKRRRPVLLDPFSGSGTTLVAAGQRNFSATGIEVNPFLAFAAEAKCVSHKYEKRRFDNYVLKVSQAAEREVPSPLEGFSTFTERHGLSKWLFNRSVLRGFTSMDREVRKLPSAYALPIRLALLASLMDCCNAKKDGKCLRYLKNWEKLAFSSEELKKVFGERTRIVWEDLDVPFSKDRLNLLRGDSRELLRKLKPSSHDLLITSPPYLNSFDYSDVYRPEMFAGGFINSNQELKNIRLQTLRSHVQVKWKHPESVASPMLLPILEEVNSRVLWDGRIPQMIQAYFEDIGKVFAKCSRVIKKSGEAWIVVSTSAYAGVEIPVDLIMADVACRNGWHLRDILVLRQMRSAGQYSKHLEPNAGHPLRESLIRLVRE